MGHQRRVFVLGAATVICLLSLAASTRGQGLADLLENPAFGPTTRPIARTPPNEGDRAVAPVTRRAEPLPFTEDQKRAAAERVRQVFGKEVAQAKTPAQKVSVAKTMTRLVPEASEPAEAYVLLQTAFTLAIDGQDPTALDEVIALLRKMFGVDLVNERRAALVTMGKKASLDSLPVVVDALIAEGGDAATAGRFDVAKEAAKAAATAARRLRDPARQKQTTELLQQLSEQEKAQAAIQPLLDRLATNPSDGQARLELGKHRCFEEGNWEAGLKLLAGCADPVLAQTARSDLAVDSSPAGRVKVADLWFALHEKESGRGQTGPLERAKFHYEQAMAYATGLTRAQILKRLDEIAKLEGGADNWVVLFRSDDPAIWNTKTDEGFLRFALPLASAPATMRYVRIRRPNGDFVVLPLNKQQLGEDTYGPRYGWRGAGSKLVTDTFLGICDATQKVSPTTVGKVYIGYKPDRSMTSGWGFGHKHKSGTQTSMAWNGQTVPKEALEISVLARELTAKERRQLKLLE